MSITFQSISTLYLARMHTGKIALPVSLDDAPLNGVRNVHTFPVQGPSYSPSQIARIDQHIDRISADTSISVGTLVDVMI